MSDKLENIQKKGIKWILFEENRSYSDAFVYLKKCIEVKLLPLSSRFDLNDLIFLHKIIYNICTVELPSYLSLYSGSTRLRSSHLDHLSLECSIIPRSSQNVDTDRAPTAPLARSFFYRTHCLWNNLPLEIREVVCPSIFKIRVIKHLWSSLVSDLVTQNASIDAEINDTFD